MKRVTASKRFFFVHLAIFAGLCTLYTVAVVSSYQDYLRAEGSQTAETRRAVEAARPVEAAPVASPAPGWSGTAILALTRSMGTR